MICPDCKGSGIIYSGSTAEIKCWRCGGTGYLEGNYNWYWPNPQYEYGWVCPRCGQVNAPYMPTCANPNCKDPTHITYSGDTAHEEEW